MLRRLASWFAVLALLSFPRGVSAESRTVTAVAGERYAVPPGGHTWILGEN